MPRAEIAINGIISTNLVVAKFTNEFKTMKLVSCKNKKVIFINPSSDLDDFLKCFHIKIIISIIVIIIL